MPAPALEIGITGPFADINLGDYGMVVNNILDLGIRHKYTLFNYNNSFTMEIVNRYLPDHSIGYFFVDPDRFRVDTPLSDRALTPLELLQDSETRQSLRNAIEPLDVLVVNGGGYFNELWAMPHRQSRLLSIIAPAVVANQLGKRVVFTANGFGPFGATSDFFSTFFNGLEDALFHCRDSIHSPGALRALGVDPKKVIDAPDDLHILNGRLTEGEPVIPFDEPYLAMECYFPVTFIEANLRHFQEFENELHRRYGLRTVFMPFHLGPGGTAQAHVLSRAIPRLHWVDCGSTGYLPIEAAHRVLRNAQLSLTSRYHGLVLSVAAGTPTLSVTRDVAGDNRYYYAKNAGFLKKALASTGYDENDYIARDFLDAMTTILGRLPEIIDRQSFEINSGRDRNAPSLSARRQDLLSRIASR